jgi:hypothetical protein
MDTPTTTARPLLDVALARLRARGLTVTVQTAAGKPRKDRADAQVRIGYGGRAVNYAVELRRGLRPNALGAVVHQIERLGERGLLIADHVTPPMAEALRASGVQFLDAAGNAYLDQPPLLVWIKGEKPDALMSDGEPTGRAFQASGLQVIFALLCHPEWAALPYRELAQRAGVAHGTVGWVMAELPKLGFLAPLRGQRTLMQRERLLQQWAEFYPRTLRPRLLLGRYQAETLAAWETLDPTRYGAVLGGETAAARLTRYLRPGTATLYANKVDPRLLIDLRLRTEPGGNVAVYRRFWTFEAANPALAPEPLVYADLMATGDGRCIETAKMIYDGMFDAHA